MMTTSAGRSHVFQLVIWVPLAILGYYLFRALRAYRRLPAQTDLEFGDRLRQRLEAETKSKKTPSIPDSESTVKKSGIDDVDLPPDDVPT